MKVLFDARPLTIPAPGGVTRLTRSLLQAVVASLPEETLLFGTTGRRALDLGLALPSNSRRVHLGVPNKVISSLTSLDLRSFEQFFPCEKPDVLLFPNNGHVGRPALPYGIVVHDLSFVVEPKWFHARGQIWHKITHAQRLMKEATRVFAVSEWTKFALQRHLAIPEERIDVLAIPRRSEPSGSGELPEVVKGKRYVLCLGGRDRRKNVSCVVEAMQELHARSSAFSDVHLVIVGGYPGPITDPRFLVLPRVDDATLNALYESASAFLYPSWYEGLGLPLHEAAEFGVPCIASSTSAMPETAPKGTLFAPPSKPHLWTLALETILTQNLSPVRKPAINPKEIQENWEKAVEPIVQFLMRQKK